MNDGANRAAQYVRGLIDPVSSSDLQAAGLIPPGIHRESERLAVLKHIGCPPPDLAGPGQPSLWRKLNLRDWLENGPGR